MLSAMKGSLTFQTLTLNGCGTLTLAEPQTLSQGDVQDYTITAQGNEA